MTPTEIAKLVQITQGNYPNWKPSEITPEVWLELLKDFPWDAIKKALKIYMSQPHEFAPNPGQLIGIIKQRCAPHKLTPDEAWSIAVGASCSGRLHEIDPRAAAAAQQVGVSRIRYADLETEIPFVRRDFIAAYERMEERDDLVQQTSLPSETNLLEMINGLAAKKQIQ